MGFKESLGHFNGGSHNDGVGSETDMHDGSICLRESMEGAVRKWTYEVEVANNGPWFWPWR